MRLVRAIPGALLWILAAVVGLVGALLCVTVIGLPLGIPLLMGARRMFGSSVRLMLPPHLAHPIDNAKSSSKDTAKSAAKETSKAGKKLTSAAPDPSSLGKKARKKSAKATKTLKKGRRKRSKTGRWLSQLWH